MSRAGIGRLLCLASRHPSSELKTCVQKDSSLEVMKYFTDLECHGYVRFPQ